MRRRRDREALAGTWRHGELAGRLRVGPCGLRTRAETLADLGAAREEALRRAAMTEQRVIARGQAQDLGLSPRDLARDPHGAAGAPAGLSHPMGTIHGSRGLELREIEQEA